jgi:hypothetical protein
MNVVFWIIYALDCLINGLMNSSELISMKEYFSNNIIIVYVALIVLHLICGHSVYLHGINKGLTIVLKSIFFGCMTLILIIAYRFNIHAIIITCVPKGIYYG